MRTDEVTYESGSVQAVYAESYASFLALPGYAAEKKFLNHRFQLVADRVGLTFRKGDTYLDLGCGLGIKTRILAERFEVATGADYVQRCIQIATLLNDLPNLSFEVRDAQKVGPHQYHCVTAFGLSVFNVSNPISAAQHMVDALDHHVLPGGWMMVYSFTDFSGKAPTGWFNHTPKQLKAIEKLIHESGYSARIIFPHRILANYFGNGVRHVVSELGKLISRKRRDYYIVIEKPKPENG